MAADKENRPRTTRSAAAKNRAADPPAKRKRTLTVAEAPSKRKRVPLGDITNVVTPPPNSPPLKPRTRSRAKKPIEAPPADDDPQMCVHYASDIHHYLTSMESEPKRRPLPDFIGVVQKDITVSMRGVLIDWLVEVAEEYMLLSDTLYLTISHIDRYLSSVAISRQKLQLLGVSSMLIAAKYEEISPPHVEKFCYITDNTYTKQEVTQMEADILKVLDYQLGNPTAKTFLRRFTRFGKEDYKYPNLQSEFLASYLAELSLLDYSCVRFLPSVVAASALFVARFTIYPNSHPWSIMLQHQTGYVPSELKDCICAIHDLQLNKKYPSLMAIREKYKNHRFKCVSMLLPHTEIPAPYFEVLEE